MESVFNHLIDSVFSKPSFALVILWMFGKATKFLLQLSKAPSNVADVAAAIFGKTSADMLFGKTR